AQVVHFFRLEWKTFLMCDGHGEFKKLKVRIKSDRRRFRPRSREILSFFGGFTPENPVRSDPGPGTIPPASRNWSGRFSGSLLLPYSFLIFSLLSFQEWGKWAVRLI
ncbi:MAG: hypothetical protein K6C40_11750, partial [Thermoguttaceae bacterium]|nr:hypothetical protein [Thermoguttaceae bacterium]